MNKDKFYGTILGLAVCDALGVPIEPEPIGERERMESLADAEKYKMLPGIWSDDTSMTLCLLESLTKNGVDQKDQLETYCKWYYDGYLTPHGSCWDIGKTCLNAITAYKKSGKITTAISSSSTRLGNGSLMRTAACALYCLPELSSGQITIDEALSIAEICSLTTHASKIACDACKYYTKLIILALEGKTKEEILDISQTKNLNLSKEVLLAIKTYKTDKLETLHGGGHVIETLKLALRAFNDTNNFTDGAVLAVNNGKDSDTVGAVYGQLAGAYYGATGINVEWLDDLINTPVIMNIIDSSWSRQIEQ